MAGPSGRRMGPARVATATLTLAVLVFAFVLPLVGRDVLVVESPLEGFIACAVGKPSRFFVYYHDYGNRAWIRLSHRVEAVTLDNPDLEVTRVDHLVRPQWGLIRESGLLVLDVVALKPGRLTANAMTLVTRAGSREVGLGTMVFDAVEHCPQDLTYDMSMNAFAGPLDNRWLQTRPVDVRRPASHPLAVEVDLSSLPVYVEAIEVESRFPDPPETQVVPLEMRLRERPPAGRGQFVWRPWVTVRAEDGATERVPGEAYTFRWHWVQP